MKVPLGVSNHHVHLTEEDYHILFGDSPFLLDRALVQTNEFASNQYVILEANGKRIERVRIIGPFRSYTQVEISKTDSRFLKIDPPVRDSGDLKDAATITLIGPSGTLSKPCAILATRHIHINPKVRKELGLDQVEKVSVFFPQGKRTTFHDVYLKEQDDGVYQLHLDTDDANGALLKTGDEGEILFQKN